MSAPSENPLKRLLGELHRPNVWQALAVYRGTAWAILEATDRAPARGNRAEARLLYDSARAVLEDAAREAVDEENPFAAGVVSEPAVAYAGLGRAGRRRPGGPHGER